jgi:hypothetical protein
MAPVSMNPLQNMMDDKLDEILWCLKKKTPHFFCCCTSRRKTMKYLLSLLVIVVTSHGAWAWTVGAIGAGKR